MSREFLDELESQLSLRSQEIITAGDQLTAWVAEDLASMGLLDEDDVSDADYAVEKVADRLIVDIQEVEDPEGINPVTDAERNMFIAGLMAGLTLAQIIGVEAVPIPPELLPKS